MSDTKSYPAPWSVCDKNGYAEIKSYNDDVCSLYGMCSTTKGHKITCDDTMANAHLISASPDMYEALEGVISEVGNMDGSGHYVIALSQDEVDNIQEALNKARGES